jgi:thiol:disulfide interchange protein DsbD
MIPGLWGAPLKIMAPFLPGAGTQDFNLLKHQVASSNTTNFSTNVNVNPPSKYVNFLHTQESSQAIENGFTTYFDYDEGLAASKALKKPLLIDFTGITCVNCRKFESAIWSNPEVAASMKNDFVIASLFTDYKEELNDNEKYNSERIDGKVNTVGEKNIDLQLKLINSNSQPNYVFVDNDGKLLHSNGYGYDPSKSAKDFLAHLELVKGEFKKRNP